MARLNVSSRTAAGEYNFANDGGVQGNINLGVFIPAFSVITNFYVRTATNVTSGGAATISFGVINAATLMVTTGIAAFTTVDSIMKGKDFSDPLISTIITSLSGQVFMTIGTADLTAGRIIFVVKYDSPIN